MNAGGLRRSMVAGPRAVRTGRSLSARTFWRRLLSGSEGTRRAAEGLPVLTTAWRGGGSLAKGSAAGAAGLVSGGCRKVGRPTSLAAAPRRWSDRGERRHARSRRAEPAVSFIGFRRRAAVPLSVGADDD